MDLFRKKGNQCKACIAAYNRKYRQSNREKIAVYNREYRQNNKEKVAAYKREYRQENKEEIAAYKREYRQENKEEIAAGQRKYRQNNKEEITAYNREYYQENKEEIAANKHEYYQENKEKVAAYNREYRQENKEEIAARERKYRQNNKEEIATRERKYRQENKEKIHKYYKKRYHSDPEYNLICRLRTRMNIVVKRAGLDKKCASTSELLGISTQGLKEWLEAQFTEDMTWENRSDWHVDHIIPCDAFDMTVEENQRICFWYKNLQPLWAEENLKKSNTYTEEEKQALISAYCNQ